MVISSAKVLNFQALCCRNCKTRSYWNGVLTSSPFSLSYFNPDPDQQPCTANEPKQLCDSIISCAIAWANGANGQNRLSSINLWPTCLFATALQRRNRVAAASPWFSLLPFQAAIQIGWTAVLSLTQSGSTCKFSAWIEQKCAPISSVCVCVCVHMFFPPTIPNTMYTQECMEIVLQACHTHTHTHMRKRHCVMSLGAKQHLEASLCVQTVVTHTQTHMWAQNHKQTAGASSPPPHRLHKPFN